MGGVAVLHPRDCLKDNSDNLFLTPLKSWRTPKSGSNLSISEGRRRSPPTSVRKNKSSATMVTDPPAVAAAKTLVMGQVKILKRGESLDESSRISKDMNDRKVSNATATTPSPVNASDVDRKVHKDPTASRKLKKKSEKKRSFSYSNTKIDELELSSTNRLGPDPELVPKQMNKSVAEFVFAGSGFVDSPPPSSLPLPGFFTKNFGTCAKEDPSTDLRRILGLSLS